MKQATSARSAPLCLEPAQTDREVLEQLLFTVMQHRARYLLHPPVDNSRFQRTFVHAAEASPLHLAAAGPLGLFVLGVIAGTRSRVREALVARSELLAEAATERRRQAGLFVRTLRERAGLSQAEVARASRVRHASLVDQVERGLGVIPESQLHRWAEALKVPPREFRGSMLRYYGAQTTGPI